MIKMLSFYNNCIKMVKIMTRTVKIRMPKETDDYKKWVKFCFEKAKESEARVRESKRRYKLMKREFRSMIRKEFRRLENIILERM